MSDTEVDYLQPGFDPATLTMPRLRSILVTYNVHYASNAKKTDLVELFHAQVAPQASKILARRARAKRSSMGIVDAGQPLESHSTSDGFDDYPARRGHGNGNGNGNGDATSGRRTTRRSTSRQATEEPQPPPAPAYGALHEEAEEDDEEDLSSRRQRRSSPRKRTTRSTSYQPAPAPAVVSAPALAAAATIVPQFPAASDTDFEPASSRRSRGRTPQVKLEPAEEAYPSYMPPPRSPQLRTASGQSTHKKPQQQQQQHRTSTDEEAIFTDDNPFQSGSSPSAPSPESSRSQRRRTAGAPVASSTKSRTSAGAANPFATASFDSAYYSRRQTTDVSSSFGYGKPSTPEPQYAEEEEEEEEDEEEEDEEEDEDEDEDEDDAFAAEALEPGEEFTPEEQLELAQEEANQRRQVASRRRVSEKNGGMGANSNSNSKSSSSGSSSSNGRIRSTSARRPLKRRGFLSAMVTPLWVLLLTLMGAYAAWYRQEKIAVGYCGLGRAAVPLLAGKLDALVVRLPDAARDYVQSLPWDSLADRVDAVIPPSWHVIVAPDCEPCPPHAFCYSDFTVRCESGYLLKPHVLSLGGLVPLPPTCEPDGERARRIKAVADKTIEELRDRRAKWECGDLVDGEGVPAADASMDVPSLKELIGEKRSKKMSKDEFDDLWTAALGDIETREEIEVEPQEPLNKTTNSRALSNTRLSSTSLARLPFTCTVRRSIRLGVARYRFPLSVLVLLAAALFYVRARFRAHLADRARVPALVDIVLERLAAQKELWQYEEEEAAAVREQLGGSGQKKEGHRNGGNGGNDDDDDDDDNNSNPHDPFLFLPQLRDDVLRSTHSLAARERIWKRVRAIVEQNSNVRAAQMQGRNGEVGRAWEWVGPVSAAVEALEGGGGFSDGGEAVGADGSRLSGSVRRTSFYYERGARRRRSDRVSLGASLGAGAGAGAGVGAGVSTAAAGAQRRSTPAAPPAEAARGALPAADRENRSALHRRWQESRPVY